jgi:3-hydroxyisobutyrate dehydrogenase
MTNVAFIGLGNMGEPMARRVRAAGHDLVVHDQRREVAATLEAAGAVWATSVREAVRDADVICLSLPGPRQVEDVVGGPGGVLANAKSTALLVDHTTNGLDTIYSVAERCAAGGLGFLDAPVSGGSAGANAGTLVVMVGGSSAHLEAARSVLEAFGDPVLHLGGVGTGTVAKLVNNQLYLCGEVLFQEGMVLGAKAGINPGVLLAMLERTGVAGTHVRTAPRMLAREFTGPGFALALAEKDVALALAAGRELAVPLAATSAAHQRLFATLAMIERASNFEVPRVVAQGQASAHGA